MVQPILSLDKCIANKAFMQLKLKPVCCDFPDQLSNNTLEPCQYTFPCFGLDTEHVKTGQYTQPTSQSTVSLNQDLNAMM